MKKIVTGLALASFLVSGAAQAGTIRPSASLLSAPGKASFPQRASSKISNENSIVGVPLIFIALGIAAVATVVVVATDGDNSPN